jgi:hypothetical protein
MDERRGKLAIELRDVEKRVYRHFRYLPDNLIGALEADEAAGTRSSFEIGENLWMKAVALKAYLDVERHPIRHRLVEGLKRLP